MRKSLASSFFLVWLLASISFSQYFIAPLSLNNEYVFSGTYDLADSVDSGFCIFGLKWIDKFPVSVFFSSPFSFEFDSASFSVSAGFQLFKSQNSTLIGYLEIGKIKEFVFGFSTLFSLPINGNEVYGRVLYSFSEIPYFIINTGFKGKLSTFNVNLSGTLLSDFQTFVSMFPVLSIDTNIGFLLIRLGYLYQPGIGKLDIPEKHVLSFGFGITQRDEIKYSVSVSKLEFFEDETVNIEIKRLSPVSVNTFGKTFMVISTEEGKEILRREFDVYQEKIYVSEKLNPGKYKITLEKAGNFELSEYDESNNYVIIKSIPKAKIFLPDVVIRKREYNGQIFIESGDSYPCNLSVKLDGKETFSKNNFIPNRSFDFVLPPINDLGLHKLEVYASGKKIGEHEFKVKNKIYINWENPPKKILTLQDISLNPPKFKFLEIIDDSKQEPYANQEFEILIEKEGSNEISKVSVSTDKDGVLLVPTVWSNGIYLINFKQVKNSEYTDIKKSHPDFSLRIDPVPKEMIIHTNKEEGVYINTQYKTILISKDKENISLKLDIQDEIGDRVRKGFLKVSSYKFVGGKLEDTSQDFSLEGKFDLSRGADEFIEVMINISPRVETGEYYLFFEIYSDSSKDALSKWIEVYKLIIYKDIVLTVKNLTLPGVVKEDVVIEGEPNKLKLLFMWKDGEPVRNAKIILDYLGQTIESYTNSSGEMIVLTPSLIDNSIDGKVGKEIKFDFSIYYCDSKIISGTKSLKVNRIERKVEIPSGLILDLVNERYEKNVNLFMSNEYDFSIKDYRDNNIVKGRTSGYNIKKLLQEVYIPTQLKSIPKESVGSNTLLVKNLLDEKDGNIDNSKSLVINLLDEQRKLLRSKYSIYGIVSDKKGVEYFLGTFENQENIQVPVNTKDEKGNDITFDEFIIIPDDNYFVYRMTSLESTSVILKPAKSLRITVEIRDEEGRPFENPARYSIYYKEGGKEHYLGSVMCGINATIKIPENLDIINVINMLRIYRNGYKIDFDLKDVEVNKKESVIRIPVRIVNQGTVTASQKGLINDFNLKLTMNRKPIDKFYYEIAADCEETFYGFPLYSKIIYEKWIGKNYFGPTKGFNFNVWLPDFGINAYLGGVEVSPEKAEILMELSEFSEMTLCHFNFEDIQYFGVKAIIKVDGKVMWEDVINKEAIFPVSNGIHTIEVVFDKYTFPIKIVKYFNKSILGDEFKLGFVKEEPKNAFAYLLKDVIYYPKENTTYKLYKSKDDKYLIPVQIMKKVKYLKINSKGKLFTLDNTYCFEQDTEFKNLYRLRYGAKENEITLSEDSINNVIAIEFYPLDDDRVVLGFKRQFSELAEYVSLVFKGFQDYSEIGNLVFKEKLTDSPDIRFVVPSWNIFQDGALELKVRVQGYDKERKFILPIDISNLDEKQISKSDTVEIDGLVYAVSIRVDPSLGDRTQKVRLKQPGEYYIDYVGTTLKPLILKIPDELGNYQKSKDGSYLVGYK